MAAALSAQMEHISLTVQIFFLHIVPSLSQIHRAVTNDNIDVFKGQVTRPAACESLKQDSNCSKFSLEALLIPACSTVRSASILKGK